MFFSVKCTITVLFITWYFMHYANCNYIIFHVLYNHSKEQKKQTFGHTETTQYNEDIRQAIRLIEKSEAERNKEETKWKKKDCTT